MRTALIIGGGANVWEDIEAALDLGEFQGVVACNDVGCVWPGRLDGWVSLHAAKLPGWMQARERNGLTPAARVAGHLGDGKQYPATNARPRKVREYVDHRFPGQSRSGSSGLFAAKYALEDLGFDRGVLCGIPMEMSQAHFFNSHPWNGAKSHVAGWLKKPWSPPQKGQKAEPPIPLPAIKGRLRSMSGWTRELLGSPTRKFIAG